MKAHISGAACVITKWYRLTELDFKDRRWRYWLEESGKLRGLWEQQQEGSLWGQEASAPQERRDRTRSMDSLPREFMQPFPLNPWFFLETAAESLQHRVPLLGL